MGKEPKSSEGNAAEGRDDTASIHSPVHFIAVASVACGLGFLLLIALTAAHVIWSRNMLVLAWVGSAVGAIILGVLGWKLVSKQDRTGKKLAGNGIILGLVSLVGLGIYVVSIAKANWAIVACSSNMRQVGQAIRLYHDANGDRFPESLQEVFLTQDIGAEVFTCPGTEDLHASGATTQEMAANLKGNHLSFIYLGKGLSGVVEPDLVIMYEPLANHGGTGMNVLFGGGHVEFIRQPAAGKLLRDIASAGGPVVYKNP